MPRTRQFTGPDLEQMLATFPSKVDAGLFETGPKVVLNSTLRAHRKGQAGDPQKAQAMKQQDRYSLSIQG